MPIIRPEIQNVLRQAGVLPTLESSKTKDERTLSDRLADAGLSLDETLEHLAYVAKESGNESLRVRVLETVAKMHGALKESAPAAPSFTIVIQESPATVSPQASQTSEFPKNLPQGVNPILLPRQLLKELAAGDSSSNSNTQAKAN